MFDTLIQIIFLKDLLDLIIFIIIGFSGPFGDEYILGAFLSFYVVPILILFNEEKTNNYLKFFMLFFFFFSIFLLNQRKNCISDGLSSNLTLFLVFKKVLRIFNLGNF